MEKNRIIGSIVCNSLVVVVVTISVILSLFGILVDDPNSAGVHTFRYFTTDSNIFAAICCLIMLLYDIKALRNSEYKIPNWVIKLKFISTVAVAVTFLVVLCYMAPVGGFAKLYYGTSFFLHLVAPLLAIVSLVFFDPPVFLSGKFCFLGVLPMAVYSVIYFVMVITLGESNGGWEDFYHFNEGGLYLVSLFSMYISTITFCYVFNVLRNLATHKYRVPDIVYS